MQFQIVEDNRGFSLVEAMVTMILGTIILVASLAFLRPAVDIAELILQKGEMQQNARVAVNLIHRDLSIAGTGMQTGGIQLPDGNGAQNSRFACDQATCYLTNGIFDDKRMYAVTPGNAKGSVINGVSTDVVTLVFKDESVDLDQFPLDAITPSGNQVDFNPATANLNDPVVGIRIGDILVLCNANGCAAAVVTQVSGNRVNFAANDPLRFNQPSAAFGNVAALANPGTPAGQYPPTVAFRVQLVTYYLDDSLPDNPRLFRQVNAQTPSPVAEHVENLQFGYDIFDENTAVATADLSDAGGFPNQIRKINISISVRSPRQLSGGRGFERMTLATSASARNLAFRDRFE